MGPQTAVFMGNSSSFLNGIMPLVIIFAVWDMIWKGIALRKAGTQKQLVRFICLFVFNTLGILPIIYLIFFQKKEKIGTQKIPAAIIKTPTKIIKVSTKTKTIKKK